jgi:hypothetical protein
MGLNEIPKTDLEKICMSLIYLHLDELIFICKKYNIPYKIYIETENKIKHINMTDNKETIIKRIKMYLQYNKILPPTIYKQKIINFKHENITENSYVYYGIYKTTDKHILNLMKELTNNTFKFGAISQKIIKNIWRRNKLITYKKFAEIWLKEYDNNNWSSKKFPELAFNNFKGNIQLWNEKRENILKLFKKYRIIESFI